LIRQLIVNADDFGLTRDVNAGIVHSHTHGILSATTLMANGDAFDDAVRLARETPTLDIGCHLVLIKGASLVTGAPFPANWKALLKALAMRRVDIEAELRAQIQKIVAAGIQPTHLDTHKHTHVHPAVFKAVLCLAVEFQIPFVRLPFDTGWLPVRPLNLLYRRKLRKSGLRATDHFTGFLLTDTLTSDTLSAALGRMPAGSIEFMCHPGYLGDELRRAPTRLKEARVRQLEALTSPAIRTRLADLQIQLTSYRELIDTNKPGELN
jgi:chitin disaccharide deacetylase